VNGLSKGAPVKYRGVEIGVVKEIRIRYHQAPNDTNIPVLIEVWGKRLRELGGEREPTPAMVQELFAQGLRTRLETLSLLTGVLYVSIDRVHQSPISLSKVPGSGGPPEIPTLPTELEEATKSAQALLVNLKAADIKGMSDSVSRAALSLSQLTSAPELRATLRELPQLISTLRELTIALSADSAKTMATLRETLESTRGAISPHAPLSAE